MSPAAAPVTLNYIKLYHMLSPTALWGGRERLRAAAAIKTAPNPTRELREMETLRFNADCAAFLLPSLQRWSCSAENWWLSTF